MIRASCVAISLLVTAALAATPAERTTQRSTERTTQRTTELSAEQALQAADQMIAPEAYEAEVQMTAYRADGSSRAYVYRTLKQGQHRLRLSFDEPKTIRGHEALRRGDDLFRYVPSLKRALRVASRDDFESGDFRQADVLRVNLLADYKLVSSRREGATWHLSLEATSREAAYDRVLYVVRASDGLPVRQEFSTSAGKLLRTLEFSEPKRFGGHLRPAQLKMTNEVARGRYTVLVVRSFKTVSSIAEASFRLEALGR